MSNVYELAPRFAALFDGLKIAHGTGKGQWIKRPLRPEDWIKHLQGVGPGIGVAPLMPDNNVRFAAIDLDEPDFEAAWDMMKFIPGTAWLESSRSGNAHVWCFFDAPCPAWLAMGVLKEATLAAGKKNVEVFPKNHDFERVRLGNYVNLPFHGDQRPILGRTPGSYDHMTLERFIEDAERMRNDPKDWQKRADWMLISPPSARKDGAEWGTQARLHTCAEKIISGEAGLVTEGGRNAVMFMLAKCLLNWRDCDVSEAREILMTTNKDFFEPPEDPSEIDRILSNVERARYTSTGCDDPLVQPYTDPTCPIAHPRR